MSSAAGGASSPTEAVTAREFPQNVPPPAPNVLQQPPLPADPHPSTLHAQQMAYTQAAMPQQYVNAHFGHPVMQWQQDDFVVHHNPDIPPISSLLLREADAWRAVLSLHSNTVASAQQISRSPDRVGDPVLVNDDDKKFNSQSREAAYCSALSSLASQCDAMFNEVLKLRTLRKARRAVEIEAASDIVRSHSDEILAIGQTLASNGSLNLSSATADLRVAIQGQRNQVSQLRVFLESVKTASSLPLPKGSKLVIGVKQTDGEPSVRELDELFKHIYEESRDVNESSLTTALSKLFLSSAAHSARSEQAESRQFARRVGDR